MLTSLLLREASSGATPNNAISGDGSTTFPSTPREGLKNIKQEHVKSWACPEHMQQSGGILPTSITCGVYISNLRESDFRPVQTMNNFKLYNSMSKTYG